MSVVRGPRDATYWDVPESRVNTLALSPAVDVESKARLG